MVSDALVNWQLWVMAEMLKARITFPVFVG